MKIIIIIVVVEVVVVVVTITIIIILMIIITRKSNVHLIHTISYFCLKSIIFELF